MLAGTSVLNLEAAANTTVNTDGHQIVVSTPDQNAFIGLELGLLSIPEGVRYRIQLC